MRRLRGLPSKKGGRISANGSFLMNTDEKPKPCQSARKGLSASELGASLFHAAWTLVAGVITSNELRRKKEAGKNRGET